MNDSNTSKAKPFDEEEYDRLFPGGFNLDESTNAQIAASARENADFWQPPAPNNTMHPTLSSQDPFRVHNDFGHTQNQYQPYPRHEQQFGSLDFFAPFPPAFAASFNDPNPTQASQNLHRQSLPSLAGMSLSSPARDSFSNEPHHHPLMSQRNSNSRDESYAELSFGMHKQDSEGVEGLDDGLLESNVEHGFEEDKEFFSESGSDSGIGAVDGEEEGEDTVQTVAGPDLEADVTGDIDEDEPASHDSEEEEEDPDYPWRTATPQVTLTSTAQANSAESSRVDRELAAVAGKTFVGIPKSEAHKLRYVRRVKFAITSLEGAQDNVGSNRIAAAYARFDSNSGAAKKFTDAQIEIVSWKVVNEAADRQKGIRKLEPSLRHYEKCKAFGTFDERMDAICELLDKWKSACADLFLYGIVGILRIVDAPTEELSQKKGNKKSNDERKIVMATGRAQLATRANTSAGTAATVGGTNVAAGVKATPTKTVKTVSVRKFSTVTPGKRARPGKNQAPESDGEDEWKPARKKATPRKAAATHKSSHSQRQYHAPVESEKRVQTVGVNDAGSDADAEADLSDHDHPSQPNDY